MIKVSIIIPAYNEGKNIAGVLKRLKDVLRTVSESHEIIVINDGSADDTGQKARDCGIEVIDHKTNLGYGKSLKDGIRASRGELILLIDADGTYDIGEIPTMLTLAKDADLVIGKRVFSRQGVDSFKNVTRRFFAYLTSYYGGKRIEDLNSGQRVFRRSDIIDRLDAFPDGFSFSSTTTVQYLLENKKIVYTPVVYNDRDKASKFVSNSNFWAIMRLALFLTIKNRPLKFSAQMCVVLIVTLLTSNGIGDISGTGLFAKSLFFILLYPIFLLGFLSYIYLMGRRVT